MTREDRTKAQELEAIRARHRGILRPKDVVAAAQAKSSPLHKYFEWDNTKAAQQYRLEQARLLIRCTIYTPDVSRKPVRMYVSLESDRRSGDSYRAMGTVLSSVPLRDELLRQALAEARAWQERYQSFRELAGVFAEIERVENRTREASKRRRKAG